MGVGIPVVVIDMDGKKAVAEQRQTICQGMIEVLMPAVIAEAHLL